MTTWLRRLFLILVALSLTAALSGVIYQFLAVSRERARYPAPGKLVDIGGYRLHIHCLGHGSPVVVLDSGIGRGLLLLAQSTTTDCRVH